MNAEVKTMNDIERRDLRKRTKVFALRIIRLYASLPKSTEAQVLGKQVIRAAPQSVRTIAKLSGLGRPRNS